MYNPYTSQSLNALMDKPAPIPYGLRIMGSKSNFMNCAAEYRAADRIVIVRLVGRTSYFETLNALLEAACLLKKRRGHLLLIDLTSAVSGLSVPELHFLALRLYDLKLSDDCRLAYVWAGGSANRRAARFYRILSRKLEYHSAAFADAASATAWLLGTP